ncbi:putative e3 ubiquitin-protein ligase ptr1 + rna transporter 1 protein [Eutypa lata UCREL1]|uniref:HECT-type E3 ubiquitin transferase n=1 Tax=Eutypa lata (strain UCR-EL1) TaxID=1287681 RepID=M7SGF0_EUTLA|nr:putative e3 ubiquitin-protein ligase ptr1 + rna transporter 1 protein [Eutypa lata UCREL1]
MGKITKTIQPKHKETLSLWLQDYVEKTSSVPLALLPKALATFPARWPFPRGDLYHWIPMLNRFDDILESFCSTYKLTEGPQTGDFGCELLLGKSAVGEDDRVKSMAELSELGYSKDGDSYLIVSILRFTQMLLDHCGNRSIYASSSHLNSLLNSTDFTIICATLRVGVELAQRYQASVKRMGMHHRQVHNALLSNHYNIELDRVQQMAQPFIKTPTNKSSASLSLSTPSSASKNKEKTPGGASKNVATMYANDLCALAKADSLEASSSDARWNGWGDVKLTYYPTSAPAQEQAHQTLPERGGASSTPATPTPLRRSSTATGTQSTPRVNRQGPSEDSPASASRSPALEQDDSSPPGQKILEIPQSAVASTPIYQLLERIPADLPKEARYEVLNRLRVAKALTESVESRQQALKARLLAIQNLAYIHGEKTFIEEVLRHDHDEPRRFQLVYQLAELIHPAADGANVVPVDLQAIALSLLEAIANFNPKLPDIFSALNATVNHGVLLYVIRKAVSKMRVEDEGDQWTEEDEWRDNLFSLTLHITMAMSNGARGTPEIISAGLLDIMVEILTIRSSIAERTYGTLVGFLDNLVYNVQSSLQTLVSADGLEVITNLVTHEVELAKRLASEGKGTSVSHRSQVVDYQVPFYQQQNLKFLLKFIHHMMSNSFAFGGNTDRLLRNLVDKTALLKSIRDIIENKSQFGSLVWTNSVTILSDFLNNDPTSFAAISEAGLVQSFLESVTGRPVIARQPENAEEDDGSSSGSPASDILEQDTRQHPPPPELLDVPRDMPPARGILPSSDAISIVPTVLDAISLNNLGMKMVVSSHAFDSYFEIFESPEHVRLMATDIELPSTIGTHFDELARHHPNLRPAISNAVLDMVARVTHLARVKAESSGWGAKLLVRDAKGKDVVADDQLSSHPRTPPVDEGKGKGKAIFNTDDSDVAMTDVDTLQVQLSEAPDNSSPYASVAPYVFACSNFLSAYIANSNLKSSFISKGGIELLLDLCTSPSLPHDFGDTAASKTLEITISQLVETSPIIGLPSLLKRTQTAFDVLLSTVQAQIPDSYLARFVDGDVQVANDASPEHIAKLAQGTSVAKALLSAQSLIRTLYHCFPYSSRTSTVTLHPVNLFDYYGKLVKSLGPLLHSIVSEELSIANSVPQSWSARKDPVLGKAGASAIDSLIGNGGLSGGDIDDTDVSDILSSTIGEKSSEKQVKPPDGPSQSDKSSPRYPQLEVPDRKKTTNDYRYWNIMLHTVYEMLVDRKFDARHSDRSSLQLIAPVLVAFKKHGGLDKLNNMLVIFKNEICEEHGDTEDSSLPGLAEIGIKKILDLYSLLVNGKVVTDAASLVNLLQRTNNTGDRRTESQVAHNLVVELRMAILPVVRELWDSPLIEKNGKHSAAILAKIISILKSISLADTENNAYLRSEKNIPPAYLQPTPVGFSWSNGTAAEVRHLVEMENPEELAQEALYRSNSNRLPASEYCAVHSAGLAGMSGDVSASTSPVQGPSSTIAPEGEGGNEKPVAREDLDQERAILRENLIDRCLDVIRAHPGSTYEVSELVSAVLLRTSGEDLSSKQEIGETLINALLSFAADDDLKSNGRSIAAYAHLLSLLLQDRGFFRASVSTLKENVSELLRFLQIPVSPASEELAPWIPYVLLVFEILLSDDEQLGDFKWKPPTSEEEPIALLEWPSKDVNVGSDDRQTLLGSILELLPRIGKEESLAVSVLRILVILTRDRTVARTIGDKKNLQRLFVMAKQLSSVGSQRLVETRITSHILVVLRHIIEDEEVIKQRMRSEIRNYLERTQRSPDPASYLRQLSHVALRDPRLFVEVTNEMVEISRWSPQDGNVRQAIILKDLKADVLKDDVAPAVRATEDLSIQDVKPSTESEDRHMSDVQKAASQESKRPVLENPDGVVHFLLCELLNYREVDDKEPSQTSKDSKPASDATAPISSGSSEPENRASDNKEKKTKSSFKADEHPIFIYRCFLLHCLTELLQSYNRTKMEFINFKRSAPLQTNTPIKPRSSILNYLLTDLLCANHMEVSSDTLVVKKKHATASQVQNLLVALVSKTGEKPSERGRDKYDLSDEPDLLFVRKFVLDTILKAYKDASASSESFETRYSKMLALADVMHLMTAGKDKDVPSRSANDDAPDRSQAQIRRLMYEKGYLAALTASIADIDLAYPPVKRTIKSILRVLRILTSTAIHLSHSNILPAASTQESIDDEIASATSLSEIEDDREETPDLYRNSALGMLEPGRDREEDYSEDSEDDDDEDMYDDEYEDEMDYEEGPMSEDREEDVSDEDEEEAGLNGMGPIEGLPGDLGVVEVTMEDDEDEDDEMDEDDEEGSDDDDELGSDGMDDDDDRIEIIDDEGNPLEDDGASAWESESVDEDDDDDEIDFEAEAQDLDEAPIHGLDDVDEPPRFGDIMRAIEQDFSIDDINGINDRPFTADEDEDEDEDDEDDDEYAYEDDFPQTATDIVARFLRSHSSWELVEIPWEALAIPVAFILEDTDTIQDPLTMRMLLFQPHYRVMGTLFISKSLQVRVEKSEKYLSHLINLDEKGARTVVGRPSKSLDKRRRSLLNLHQVDVPPAIQRDKEHKAKEAEQKRKLEEERKKREEEDRKAREAKEAEEKIAREKKEAEERERAAAAAQAVQAEMESVEVPEPEPEHDDQTDSDAMEGVEVSDSAADAAQDTSASQPRAFTTIRGAQVDVTELGIDADYLEALPEEFREEVIAQTVSTRRAQAREAPRSSGEQTEVFQEFLDALPDELRLEIVQQERQEQRRREREEATRRQAIVPGQTAEAQDMDTASILMTFPPALREQVLMDQGADIMDSLPPEMAAQARRLVRSTNPIAEHARAPVRSGHLREAAEASGQADGDNKVQRKTVVQMLDKSGVATLLRLMFINVKGGSGSIESNLKHVFKDVCENRQNRLEVVSTLLQILQDGTTDVDAVERSFTHLSIKAKQPKDKDKDPKTPGLKRTFTNTGSVNPVQPSSETSPLMIVQQCLDLLCYLAESNVHVPSLFLTEHDVAVPSFKRSLSRKGKGKDLKALKYAINSLLALLDRDLVMESSSLMDSLSQLLSRVTFPLLALERKQKEAAEAVKKLETGAQSPAPAAVDSTEQTGDAAPTDENTEEHPPETTTPTVAQSDQPAAPSAPEATSAATTERPNVEADPSKALEKKQAILKKVKHLHPPVIPVNHLTLIINIFVARECSSRTFKETLSTIKNLSAIPGAMLVFGQELARQAQVLSEKIVIHLNELLPHIEKASSGTEIQGVALSKFSPGASDQNKLLRVLTALDHLFAQKKSDPSGNSDVTADETKKQDLLATLYRNPTFNALWDQLSACLGAIRQRENLMNVATILLPLIEALMVVCKDTAQTEAQAQNQTAKEMLLSSPQPESHMAGLFFTFTEEHRRILNELVRNNPSLMKGTFSNLVKNPKVLEFDNKRNWFNRSVHNRNQQAPGRGFPTLQLQVRREHVFHDSFKSLYFKSGDEMKFGKLSIRFHGEEGVDAGGVTREWFQVLSRQMFDPNYALFVPVSSDRTTFHPNKLSGINDEHLMFFKFIGRVIGKALYEGRVLDCYFSRAVYKRILGKPVSVKDMESFDPDYYKSLVWMLENDITDIITESFSVEDDVFGVTRIEDLCEDGRNVPVTEDNKHEYVRLVVEHKLLSSVKEQMENFLKGFHEIIPAELISIFNEQELELLISGLPDIDVDDWKSNTEYHNYTPSSPQIQWFWRAVRSLDKEELAKLLQFVTGTSKVPLNGFKELEGMNGVNRFNIHRDYGNKDRLPSSHTCFNQLDLPEYESYDALRRQLLKAITAGSDYFGFA